MRRALEATLAQAGAGRIIGGAERLSVENADPQP
jgi:hypothetical protein